MSLLPPKKLERWLKDWPAYWVTNEGWNVDRDDLADIMDSLAFYLRAYKGKHREASDE